MLRNRFGSIHTHTLHYIISLLSNSKFFFFHISKASSILSIQSSKIPKIFMLKIARFVFCNLYSFWILYVALPNIFLLWNCKCNWHNFEILIVFCCIFPFECEELCKSIGRQLLIGYRLVDFGSGRRTATITGHTDIR